MKQFMTVLILITLLENLSCGASPLPHTNGSEQIKTGPLFDDFDEKVLDAGKWLAARAQQTIREQGADNITWVFHSDANDWPDKKWNRFENYYPGDDVVDWIGVSAYGPQTPMEDECQ